MIALDIKQDASTTSSPLSLVPKEEKGGGTLSFSELLQGIGADKDAKVIQNGALLLSLKDSKDAKVSHKETKSETLLSLLTQEESKLKNKEPLAINPEITNALSPKDLKILIKEAKQFLKDKIVATEGFKRAEIAKLPKTLKGLVQVAKKVGIDISKITLEEVQIQSKKKSPTSLLTKDNAIQEEPKALKAPKKVKPHLSTDDVEIDVDMQKVKESKVVKNTQEVSKATPLFKAETATKISTQQIVQTKTTNTIKQEQNTPKKRSDDTLKLLLQGEKVAQQQGSKLTTDFSVATAKVIAPQHKHESAKSLESLLKGDSDDDTSTVKHDGLQVAKADSFEVKLNEAKQMTKYLSADVKSAIEDYKAPFTRVKVQLNPQRLGEIDLTIVQRGKNLHVNLSSNNAAINALSMNANDLKIQLQNSGIQNASLNFSNNSQSDQNAAGGQPQQQQQNRQNAHEEYNYFENEEKNEEITHSLEIVVPYYA